MALRIKPEMLYYGLQVLGFCLVICSLADQTPNQRLLFSRQDAKLAKGPPLSPWRPLRLCARSKEFYCYWF